jgi:hypothetical protein
VLLLLEAASIRPGRERRNFRSGRSISTGRVAPLATHEVWLELSSGSRVIVGSDLPDVPAANIVATRWKAIAETRPDELHETIKGSGVVVRGSAIIAIKAQAEPKASSIQSIVKVPRDGNWL